MRYYWRDGTPATPTRDLTKSFDPEWLQAMWQVEECLGDLDYKRVAATVLPDGKWVSTVWLGLDHNWGDGPPVIFETMVFANPWNSRDLDSCRYRTEADAMEGHAKMAAEWRAKVTLWGRLWWLVRPSWLVKLVERRRLHRVRRKMRSALEGLANYVAKRGTDNADRRNIN